MVPYSSTEEEEKEEDSFLTTSCSLNEFLLLTRLFRNFVWKDCGVRVVLLLFSVSVTMNLRICDDEFTTCMCILLELQMSS